MNTYDVLWSKIKIGTRDAWSELLAFESRLEQEHYMVLACFVVLLLVFMFVRRAKPVTKSRRRSRVYFIVLALVVLLSFSGSYLFLPGKLIAA